MMAGVHRVLRYGSSGASDAGRHAEPDQRPAAGPAGGRPGWPGGNSLGPDRSAVAFGHLADDGQPEARAGHAAGRRRPVEAVEHVRQVAGRDAGPMVAHGELAGVQAHLHGGPGRAELGRGGCCPR